MMTAEDVPLSQAAESGGGVQRHRHRLILLLAVVYFVDREHHRWLRFGALGGLQPSELAKPALVIFLAFFVTWRAPAINNRRYTLAPAALAVGLVMFAVVVADLGTPIVLGAAVMSVFFVAGLRVALLRHRGGARVGGRRCVRIAAKPYRLARVVRYVDPQFKMLAEVDHEGTIQRAWIKCSCPRATPTTRRSNRRSRWARAARRAWG